MFLSELFQGIGKALHVIAVGILVMVFLVLCLKSFVGVDASFFIATPITGLVTYFYVQRLMK